MEELAKIILTAPALNVALLCVALALFVLFKREKKLRKADGTHDNGTPVLTAPERWHAHFAREQEMESTLGRVVLRVERLEVDVAEHERKLDTLLPEVATLKESIRGLEEKVSDIHEGQFKLSEKMDKILDRLLK